jgi:two-component system sensor histidine kinase KdpD
VTKELAQSIFGEADRLNRFLRNLLDMTRLESGSVRLRKEWNSVEECFGAAIGRLREALAPYKIVTKIPADLPLIYMDALLIEQVLVNLLDNAAKYSIVGTEIVLSADLVDSVLNVSVLNHGLGIAEGEEEKIFDKFYRSGVNDTIAGTGLGLTICRSIVQFHGGKIWAERLQANMTRFVFTLPAAEQPPAIVPEEEEILG